MGPIDHPAAIVVCDAGPLIHLDELDSLHLLAGFREILIPEIVQAELLHHRPAALRSQPLRELPSRVVKSQPTSPELQELARFFSLDPGELAALELQSTTPGAILLTDDSAARLAAKALN